MNPVLTRRGFFRGGIALGAVAFTTPGLFAEELLRTPSLTEGPFYPDKLPLDTDNDLLIINDSITPAVGLSGQARSLRGPRGRHGRESAGARPGRGGR